MTYNDKYLWEDERTQQQIYWSDNGIYDGHWVINGSDSIIGIYGINEEGQWETTPPLNESHQ